MNVDWRRRFLICIEVPDRVGGEQLPVAGFEGANDSLIERLKKCGGVWQIYQLDVGKNRWWGGGTELGRKINGRMGGKVVYDKYDSS